IFAKRSRPVPSSLVLCMLIMKSEPLNQSSNARESRASRGSCFIRTPRNQSERLQQTSKTWVSISCRLPATVYAPKGSGALFVRRGVSIESLIHGAGHEAGRRAGTESALLSVGVGKACELAHDLGRMDEVQALRDHFWQV